MFDDETVSTQHQWVSGLYISKEFIAWVYVCRVNDKIAIRDSSEFYNVQKQALLDTYFLLIKIIPGGGHKETYKYQEF